MPPIRADLAKTSTFTLREKGDYPATVFAYKRKVSNGAKTAGADIIEVQYKYADGGGSIWDNVIVHPTTLFRLKQLAVAAGIPGETLDGERTIGFRDDIEALPPDDVVAPVYLDDLMEEILGAEVVLAVEVEEARDGYDARNRVKRVKNPTEALVGSSNGTAGW